MKKFFYISAFAIMALVSAAVVTAAPAQSINPILSVALGVAVFAGIVYTNATHYKGDFSNVVENNMAGFNMYRRPTPQAKQVIIGDRLGNPGIKDNQGTTVEVYDYIKVVTNAKKQTLEFFNDVNTKSFPFTNLKENKLQVGESLAIEYMFFTQMVITDASGEVKSWGSLQALFPGTNVAQFSVLVDNQRVMKPVTLARSNKLFNVNGSTAENHVFYPDTDLVLPTELQFIGQLLIPPVTVTVTDGDSLYMGLHWTGSGAILNLKHNV